MRILVLGAGLQGRAAVYDLARSEAVTEVVAADRDVAPVQSVLERVGLAGSVPCHEVDAEDPDQLDGLLGQGFDVIVDLLPVPFHDAVAEVALRHRVHLVTASYPSPAMRGMAARTADAGIALLPEMGLDPGLDLVLLGEAVRRLDQVDEIRSYAAGFPEPAAADNPLGYKVTWRLEGVLASYLRPGRVVHDGAVIQVPGSDLFAPQHLHQVEVPGVGRLEAFVNGDALHYLEPLGLAGQRRLRHLGRYVLRWPGHGALWRPLVDLHVLDDEPVLVDGRPVSRRRFLAAALEPHLGYSDDERDVAVVRVEVSGSVGRERKRVVLQLVDRRDLASGLYAMNRTTGFTAAIGALLLADGTIPERGLLSPARHVPFDRFVVELERRGLHVT